MARSTSIPWLGMALAVTLGTGVRAQEPPAVDRLQQLLRDLATLDDKAWATRLQQLEGQAKASADEAAKLRAQAAAIEQQAQAKDAATKQLRDEIEQLKQLQALAQKLPRPAAMPDKAPKLRKRRARLRLNCQRSPNIQRMRCQIKNPQKTNVSSAKNSAWLIRLSEPRPVHASQKAGR